MNFIEFLNVRLNSRPYDVYNTPLSFSNIPGSDISAHMPMLSFLATKCNHITEFGVRECYSTSAFLSRCIGEVISYDINVTQDILTLLHMDKPCKWTFIQQNTIDPNFVIQQTDLLFLDTDHTYEQVQKELKLHHSKVNKYIVFHDTTSFPVINQAIFEFLHNNTEWTIVYDAKFNNGLIVITKDV